MSSVLQIERQLGNIERVRTLYEKYLEWSPANCTAWCKFAEFEQQYLGEVDRARAIYELAIAQPVLDMPEVLWKVKSALHGCWFCHRSSECMQYCMEIVSRDADCFAALDIPLSMLSA